MNTKAPEVIDLHSNFDDLHITESSSHALIPVTEPQENPWRDQSDETSVKKDEQGEGEHRRTLHMPDPSTIDPSITQGFAVDSEAQEGQEPLHMHTAEDVLLEFDPLGDPEEKAAREAWANAPSHPPPPAPAPIPDLPSPPEPPPKDVPNRASSPIPAFPALAALARSFSIPLVSRGQRPRSLDTAAAVPSPSTISSFATQQAAQPLYSDTDETTPGNASGSAIGSTNESGRGTPLGSRAGDAENGSKHSQAFDFQKFLDQMKSRSAEPVAKYLRSYVSILMFVRMFIYPHFFLLLYPTFFAYFQNHISRFLSNFAKRTFTVGDQVKLINDFLNVSDCEDT